MQIIAIFLILTLSLLSEEIPEQIKKSAQIYQKERNQIKNYRVSQDITSITRSMGYETIEKRKQIGYFVTPNRYFFFTKERIINNSPLPVNDSSPEKSLKKDIEWLSVDGIKRFDFTLIQEGGSYLHYSVIPKQNTNESKGEIWINKETGKIIRMLKEPRTLKEGLEVFKTELYFDVNFSYQEPSFTRLNATFYENGKKVETKVEVLFYDYQFNVDLGKLNN